MEDELRRFKRKGGQNIGERQGREGEKFMKDREKSRRRELGHHISVSTARTAVSIIKLRSASFSAKVRKRTVDQDFDMYVMHRLLISSLRVYERVYGEK